ncbi:MAG TPA: type II secretion system protein GspC [Gammaproteobacteria bacterium]|nr:type II secretion system protein GspC [Gammaproteobacteria bacterium]
MKLALNWNRLVELLGQEVLMARLAMVVNLGLILVLAALLADLTWRLVPRPQLPPPPLAAAAVHDGEGMARGTAGNLAQLHLFGTRPAAGKVVAKPVVMPETRLQLILRGVFASSDPAAAGAIIAERNGKEAFYGVGDRLPGGAVLKEVHEDRIVLQRRGRLETLRMPREETAGGATGVSRRTARSSRAVPSLREYRDMVLENPQQLADKVRLTPRTEGGRMVGYEVRPGRDARFLSRFGLRPGDVVTAVNGIALNSPAKGLSILRSLARTDQVRLEILRNGSPQTIELDASR